MGGMESAERARRRDLYARRSAFPVFVLGVLFVVGFIEVVSGSDAVVGRWLMAIGWLGFVLDLVWRWVIDEDPRHFPRHHWLAFVAVILPVFKVLFVAYVFVRLATGRQRLQSRVQVYAAYLTVLVITFGASLVLGAERDYPGSNIHTFPEAVWWACVTVATVGYGDFVPVSPTGRMIATVMLVNGVVLISVVTATVAARFVSDPDEGEVRVTLDTIDERLDRIDAALAALRAASASPVDGGPRTDPAPGSTSA
jgi:voltage-gated potassium channel